MGAGRCVDQLAGDAQPTSRLADTALQHVTHAQLPGHLAHVDCPALVGKGRISCDHEQLVEAGQGRDDVLDHAVDEILLFEVARHVGERQYGNRGLVWQSWSRAGRSWRDGLRLWRGFRSCSAANRQRIDPQWLSNVLEPSLTKIADGELEPGFHLTIGVLRKTDGARRGESLQSRRDIDAVAHQVAVTLLDDIA